MLVFFALGPPPFDFDADDNTDSKRMMQMRSD